MVGEAKDETQAGKAKDYLRQVISYEYSNFEWEKDNFKLNESYKGLIDEILASLG